MQTILTNDFVNRSPPLWSGDPDNFIENRETRWMWLITWWIKAKRDLWYSFSWYHWTCSSFSFVFSGGCDVAFSKLRCIRYPNDSFNELLFSVRTVVNWQTWSKDMPVYVCRCAQAAAQKNYNFFTMTFWGQVFSINSFSSSLFLYKIREILRLRE